MTLRLAGDGPIFDVETASGDSVRQTGAAFGTPGVDDLAAATGSHAGTETVRAGTLETTGLESSFHVSTLAKALKKDA